MKRSRVNELHFITPVETLASLMRYGILSHTLAERVPHLSVASVEVQSRRASKQVPGGRKLHHYANLYFDAPNDVQA